VQVFLSGAHNLLLKLKAELVQLLHAFGSRRSSDKELEHRICRSTCPDP